MAFTKVRGRGVTTTDNYTVGVITATKFVGPITGGGGGIQVGLLTATGLDINGDADISGNLTVGGDFTTLNTTLREVELLHVDANSSATAGIITQRGSGDILNLFDNNTEVVTVKDGGHFGIGTVTPYYPLDVRFGSSTTALSGGSSGDWGGLGLRLQNNNTTVGSMSLIHFRTGNHADWHIGTKFVGANDSDIVFLQEGVNEKLRIKNDGKVGIGTADPGSPLEVSGGTALDTATFNTHHANGVLINLQRSGTSKGFLGSGKNIADATGGVDDIGLRSNANLIFTSGGGTERVRITSAGRVGINTTVPTAPLNVQAENSTGACVRLNQEGTNKKASIYFQDATTTGNDSWITNENFDLTVYAGYGGKLNLGAYQTTGITVLSTGKVGIGEDDPATLLEVSAGTNKNLNVWSSGAYATGITIGSANDAFSGYTPLEFRASEWYFHNGTAERLRINSSGHVGIKTTGDLNGALLAIGNGQGANIPSGEHIKIAPSANTITFLDSASNGSDTGNIQFWNTVYNNCSAKIEFFHAAANIGGIKFHTTPAAGSPVEALRIDHEGIIWVNKANPLSSSLMILDKDGSGEAALRFYNAGSNKAQIALDSSEELTFDVNGAERLRIKDDGRVNIGQASDVDHTLCVAGTDNTTSLTGGHNQGIQLQNKSTTDGTYSQIEWRTSSGGRYARIAGIQDDANGNGGQLVFLTETSGGTTTERLRIKSDGNLKIPDDGMLELGTYSNGEFRIYHSSSNVNFIDSPTNRQLQLKGDGGFLIRGGGNQNIAQFNQADGCDLYHNQTLTLETTSSGISVTGEVAASQDYPNFRSTLDLNFEAVQKLDPRITYFRLGPASYVDKKGLVVLVGDNVPRFDHSFPEFWDEGNVGDTNSVGVPKGLLMEESRTNIYKNNHNLITANDHGSVTQTVNTTETTAPDGTFTATKVDITGGDQWMRFDVNNGLDNASVNFTDTFSTSVYMKTVGTSNVNVSLDFGDGGNKTFSVGQDWKRYAISNVHQNYGGSTKFIDFVLQGDIYIWGLQCENGAFPTSYIPTNGATAIRGEDSAVIDGDDFNEFFDHTGAANQNYTGTLLSFMEFEDIKYIPNASRSNRVQLELNNDNKVQLSTVGGGSPYVDSVVTYGTGNQADFTGSSGSTFPNMLKHGISFAKNNFAYSYNGNTVETDTSGNVGGTSTTTKYTQLSICKGPSKVHMKRIIYYADRLSNSQLVTLTS